VNRREQVEPLPGEISSRDTSYLPPEVSAEPESLVETLGHQGVGSCPGPSRGSMLLNPEHPTLCPVLCAYLYPNRFPFYFELKIAFVIWLLSPYTKGSSVLYRKFVHPTLSNKEKVCSHSELSSQPAPAKAAPYLQPYAPDSPCGCSESRVTWQGSGHLEQVVPLCRCEPRSNRALTTAPTSHLILLPLPHSGN
jgi:hypothetical protein